jgi:Sigma-70, region 4
VALTDEQRAMLQLLLEGGQTYEDIGSLLGIGPEEVRSRARSALREIGGADPDAEVGLSDYLLGQADPIGRADAVRYLQSDPEANALAERLVQNLRLLAPKAQLPEVPEPRGGRRAPAPSPPAAPPAQPPPAGPQARPAPVAAQSPGLASRVAGVFSGIGGLTGRRRTQFLAGLAAALAVVIVVIVVATSGDSSSGSDCKAVDTSAAQQAGVPTIKLTAMGPAADADCPPSGQLTLGRIPQSQKTNSQIAAYALQANTVHMPATASGEGYLFWLYKSDSQAVPLGPAQADSNGNLTSTLSIPIQELVLFPAFQTIRLAKVTPDQAQQVQQSIRSQGKKPTLLVPFVGDTVLQGNVSELGLDQLLQQAQSQAGQAQQGGAGKKG